MRLNYFKIEMTAEELKKERNRLWKIHHPDKAKEADRPLKNKIMQEINAEYDYVLKNGQKQPENDGYRKWTGSHYKPNESKGFKNRSTLQEIFVQNIFHALTKNSGVDIDLLLKTLSQINEREIDIDIISDLFHKTYHVSLFEMVNQKFQSGYTLFFLTKYLAICAESGGSLKAVKKTLKKVFNINIDL